MQKHCLINSSSMFEDYLYNDEREQTLILATKL